jgi:dolichol kinase
MKMENHTILTLFFKEFVILREEVKRTNKIHIGFNILGTIPSVFPGCKPLAFPDKEQKFSAFLSFLFLGNKIKEKHKDFSWRFVFLFQFLGSFVFFLFFLCLAGWEKKKKKFLFPELKTNGKKN